MTTSKEALTTAFKAMRAAGLIARQGFMCCCNCAGSAIAHKLGEMPEAKRAAVKGTVFYTKQDADVFKERRGRWEAPTARILFIAFGEVEVSGVGTFGNTKAAGEVAVRCLRDAGLTVEWDGNTDHKIQVEVQS